MNNEDALRACADAAQSVLLFIEEIERTQSLPLPLQFLKALASLTQRNVDDGIDPTNMVYEPKEILGWLEENVEAHFPSENISSYVSKQFRDLMNKHLNDDVRIEGLAAENQLTFYGIPGKITGGGKGKANQYRLEVLPVSHEMKTSVDKVTSYSLPDAVIHYKDQKKKGLPKYIKWVDDLDIVGWKLYLLLACILFPLLAFIILLLSISVSPLLPRASMFVWSWIFWPITLGATFIAFFGFIYRMLDKRVAIVPDWLTVFSRRVWLLEYKPIVGEEGKYRHRRISLVNCSGDCPVCGGIVVIGKGGWQFPGRLVGRCDENPVEHVFTFDHVTRSGKALR